jgi:hypothetical protein
MTQPTSFHDVELISAYLDHQLSQVERQSLESRLKNELQLHSIMAEISEARAIMRKLPARKAPRNFRLTPQMAGIRPPLPRLFPIFRLASVMAAALFFFVFAANLSLPALAAMRTAAPAPVYGMGGGGGGSDTAPLAAAAPAAAAPPLEASPELSFTPAPDNRMQAEPTASAEMPVENQSLLAPGAQAKSAPTAQEQPQALPQPEPIRLPVPASLQFGLLGLAILSGGTAYFLRARAEGVWFKAQTIKPGKPTPRQVILTILVLLAVIGFAISIYYVSSTTFYMPAVHVNPFPVGPVMGDKGPLASGDKGASPSHGAQAFTLIPGLGYNFSATDVSGLATGMEFPANIFHTEIMVSYIPGLDGTPPNGIYFSNHAFSLIPADKNLEPQAPFTITLDYGDEVVSVVDENNLLLLWWSGSEWQDAAGTCTPPASYTRLPEENRLRVDVCKMGSFLLAAP